MEMKSLSSDPLFSSIITFYTLILLYFPSLFLPIFFSPVLVFTAILLLTLLRLGAIQRIQETESNSISTGPQQRTHGSANSGPEKEAETEIETDFSCGSDRGQFYTDSFFEWNVGAPLDVIYEAYEGEEEYDDDNDYRNAGDASEDKQDDEKRVLNRHPSLSLYYPESDSDSSSESDFAVLGDWDSPERMCFQWEEEDREELIEIALDGNRKGRSEGFHVEEDNLIEIDISPAKVDEFPSQG